MVWFLSLAVIVICWLTYRETVKREKVMQEIEASAKRIEKLAIESERLSRKVAEKYGKK